MAADMHIHILEGITIDVLRRFQCNTLGSPFWDPALWQEHNAHGEDDYRAIGDTPNVWVGEVSWLKAAMFGEPDKFIPNPVMALWDLFKDGVVEITDDVIAKAEKAFGEINQTSYAVEKKDAVIAFLKQHKGKKAFTISW